MNSHTASIYVYVCINKIVYIYIYIYRSSIPGRSQNDYNNYFIRRGSGPLCLSILKVITRCLRCPTGTASTIPPFEPRCTTLHITWCTMNFKFGVGMRVPRECERNRPNTIGSLSLCTYTDCTACVYTCVSRNTSKFKLQRIVSHGCTYGWIHACDVTTRAYAQRLALSYADRFRITSYNFPRSKFGVNFQLKLQLSTSRELNTLLTSNFKKSCLDKY